MCVGVCLTVFVLVDVSGFLSMCVGGCVCLGESQFMCGCMCVSQYVYVCLAVSQCVCVLLAC